MGGVLQDVGCGILGPNKCGMWDFGSQEMWDVGFEEKCGMWDFKKICNIFLSKMVLKSKFSSAASAKYTEYQSFWRALHPISYIQKNAQDFSHGFDTMTLYDFFQVRI